MSVIETETNIVERIKSLLEEARTDKKISNSVARLVTVALTLEGDEAELANRLIAQGSDPLSLAYFIDEKVPEGIRTAHFQGPGSLVGDARNKWLTFAHFSTDESKTSKVNVRDRVRQFFEAVDQIICLTPDDAEDAAKVEFDVICSLPFTVEKISGLDVRVYSDDRGFAAAYWSGEEFAANRGDDGLTFVGSNQSSGGRPLAEIGLTVDKPLGSHFGIIFPK